MILKRLPIGLVSMGDFSCASPCLFFSCKDFLSDVAVQEDLGGYLYVSVVQSLLERITLIPSGLEIRLPSLSFRATGHYV